MQKVTSAALDFIHPDGFELILRHEDGSEARELLTPEATEQLEMALILVKRGLHNMAMARHLDAVAARAAATVDHVAAGISEEQRAENQELQEEA